MGRTAPLTAEVESAIAALPRKQGLFVREYLVDLNGRQAYMRAGYSSKNADVDASKLLVTPKVRAAVALAMQARAERTRITADRALQELARIGFSDVRRLFDDAGCLRRPEDMDDDTAAAVSSIKVTTRNLGEGEVEHVAEVKFWDKNAALDKIARHLGMLNDKLKIQGDAENPLAHVVRVVKVPSKQQAEITERRLPPDSGDA